MIKRWHILMLDIVFLAFLFLGRCVTWWMLEWEIPCVFLQRGIMCPACGGTHCLHSFLQGNIAEAFMANSYVFSTIILLIGIMIALNIMYMRKECCLASRVNLRTIAKWTVIWAIGFALFGVIRNVFIILK